MLPPISTKVQFVTFKVTDWMLGDKARAKDTNISYKRIGIGQCPIFYRPPHFSAKTHAAIVTNVVNGLIKPFAITFRTTTEAVVVGLTSNSS